ncbi:hypothetical protein FQN54_000883 [Arachnomyces sp. PD_36]|nr:hypothetical protein FQN54_000883 [Arachnomyces sp. PD_36]
MTFEPFLLLTPRLILTPTPLAISLPTYRALYSSLHSNVDFCQMAFGEHFPPVNWSDEETRDSIRTRDIERSWERFGLGDFAVGLREESELETSHRSSNGRVVSRRDPLNVTVLRGTEFEDIAGRNNERLHEIKWVGYAGVRDATSALPPRGPEDTPLPPWNEMVEVRYGVSSEFWGKGMAKEAMEVIMQWSVDERGVKRFIAETERGNVRSARLLGKMGFGESGTDYWREESEVEWEFVVG